MSIPRDFQDLLPLRQAAHGEPDDRPLDYLWVYDPQEAKVHIQSGEVEHPADFPTHETMCEHVTHPERRQGYAYSIKGGWRITDEDHHKVEDPYILKRILAALGQKHPVDLPHIRHHGDPLRVSHHADNHA